MASNVNTLSIDVNGLWMAIQNECYVLLNDVAAKIIEGFQLYIVSDGAGRIKWRENAAKEFKILSEKMSDDMMEMTLGVHEDLETEAWTSFYYAQIMVALFGNYHGSMLTTKPGEITFHDHMETFDESHAETVWTLPAGFNWPDPGADKMLKNVMKITEDYFKTGLSEILRNINFYDYVYVN